MATYYIGPNGDDTTGDGSESNPWLNLQYARDNSSSDDTILVKQGTLTQTLSIDLGFSNRKIIGETQNPNDTIIDINTLTLEMSVGLADAKTIVKNLTFLGGESSRRKNSNFKTSRFVESSLYFENCVFKNIACGGTTTVRDPESHIFGGDSMGSIRFIGCYFIDLYIIDDGTIFVEGGLLSGNSNMEYELTNCIYYMSGATQSGKLPITTIVGGDPKNCNLKNLIAYDVDGVNGSDRYVAYSYQTTDFVFSDNCCFYGLTDSPSYTIPTDTNIFVDPLFVDGPNLDFRLSSNSPCIGAGTIL